MYRTDWISKWAEYAPERIAIREYGSNRSLTYRQMNLQANFLARYFTEVKGLGKGDRVMVLAEHCLEYVVLFSVMQKTGLIMVPVNFRLATSEIEYVFGNCQPSLFIVEDKFSDKVVGFPDQMDLAEITTMLSGVEEAHFESLELEEDHPVFIMYTSGSTGFPKGARYTHKMLLWNSLNTTQSLEITQTDHTINCMPPFHTGGWNVLLTPMLHRGASVGLMKRFDADELLSLLEQEKSNLFMGVPTILKMMSESPLFDQVSLKALRYFIVGGEALPLEVIQTWHRKGVKIRQGYGLTEVGPNLTSLHQDDAERKIGSIGKANFYVDFKLVDDDDQEVSRGEIGEFCLKGPMVMPGYWNNDEATKKTIVDGWFHTGDLVRQDEEGFIYVVDRKKLMFISGGENVYPAEVERVIRTCKGVDEVAVVGVKDDKWGEVGKAFVKMRTGAAYEEDLVRKYCLQNLAKFKVPKYFEAIADIPKNGSGKIDRNALKSM